MVRFVASQPASTFKNIHILELQSAGDRIGTNDTRIEVDQMAVGNCSTLARTDSVGIVAGRTGSFLMQMLAVLREAFVVQNAVATVALLVAKLV